MLLELFSAVAVFSVRAEGITKKLNVIFFQLFSNNSQLMLLQRQSSVTSTIWLYQIMIIFWSTNTLYRVEVPEETFKLEKGQYSLGSPVCGYSVLWGLFSIWAKLDIEIISPEMICFLWFTVQSLVGAKPHCIMRNKVLQGAWLIR